MSKIEWTNKTWNFLAGCSPVSEGFRNCYAAKEAIRLAGNPHPLIAAKYEGTAEMRGAGDRRRAVFTGRVNVAEDVLAKPLSVRKPLRWFVNSMADLFHPAVPFDVVDRAFAVMALCPQHTFQILTKRPERMAEYLLSRVGLEDRELTVLRQAEVTGGIVFDSRGSDHWRYSGPVRPEDVADRRRWPGWPLPNVWLGTSVEDQAAADERIPHLVRCPAAVRFLSCEPLIGPVDLAATPAGAVLEECDECSDVPRAADALPCECCMGVGRVTWVIVGGESGHGARPMHPEWARSLRDQCQVAGVAFFFKQWGEWLAVTGGSEQERCAREGELQRAGRTAYIWPDNTVSYRVGKAAAGRLLDGVEHSAFPEVARA